MDSFYDLDVKVFEKDKAEHSKLGLRFFQKLPTTVKLLGVTSWENSHDLNPYTPREGFSPIAVLEKTQALVGSTKIVTLYYSEFQQFYKLRNKDRWAWLKLLWLKSKLQH